MIPVAPRHPFPRAGSDLARMPEQLHQILERVHAVELAGVNQTHEQVAHLCPVQRAVEQSVLAVQHRQFQRPLADVVVQRRSRLAKEQSQCLPVSLHVADRLAQPRVRLRWRGWSSTANTARHRWMSWKTGCGNRYVLE